jgi:hypothetical protein
VVQGDAKVVAGDLVARIVDAGSWRVSVLMHGDPPAGDAECEVDGDGDADQAACQVVDVAPAGGDVAVTVAVTALTAPWLEQARSPYVRLGSGRFGAVARGEAP